MLLHSRWGPKRSFVGQNFWARGYFVSTVWRDEDMIREYIRNQEREDEGLDQMNLWCWAAIVEVARWTRGRLATPSSRFERLTT